MEIDMALEIKEDDFIVTEASASGITIKHIGKGHTYHFAIVKNENGHRAFEGVVVKSGLARDDALPLRVAARQLAELAAKAKRLID